MITIKLLRRLCITLLSGLFMMAGAQADAERHNIELLLRNAGVHEQIQQFPKAMIFKIEQIHEQGQCDSRTLLAIKQAIDKTINTSTMTDIVAKDIAQHVSALHVQQLLEWYDTPLGKKIVTLEQAATTPAAIRHMKHQGELLLDHKSRLARIKEIDKALQASDWAVNVELQASIAMSGGMAQIQNRDITHSLVHYASQLEEKKAALKPQVEKTIWIWYMYTFQKLSDAELDNYIAFLQQENTSHFNRTALKSLAHAITEVVENFIISIENQTQADKQAIDK